MAYVITIASNEERFEQIILELEPIIKSWPFLRETVFIHAPVGATIIWRNGKPMLAQREAIIIHGLDETGGNFDSTQGWKYKLKKEFKEATGISVSAP